MTMDDITRDESIMHAVVSDRRPDLTHYRL